MAVSAVVHTNGGVSRRSVLFVSEPRWYKAGRRWVTLERIPPPPDVSSVERRFGKLQKGTFTDRDWEGQKCVSCT
ncbi:hypothetical protein BaRGS_00022846 [Batillaria attramentaria]|uniref:Uncharacterized protein n=1 Tax=Batillaria attramentaria TaxID=370345 RepID=A0ABD0KFM7_9CAEN